MRRVLLLLVVLVPFGGSIAHAQPRLYAALTMAADGGGRGNVPGDQVPSVGGLIGFRLTKSWNIEVEAERGFLHTTNGSGEATLLSFPPSRNPSPAEIEAYGIRVRDQRTQRAGPGLSLLAAWRSREPGRVNVEFLAGVSARAYRTTLVRTTTFVSPLAQLPANFRLPDENSARRMTGTGLTGGGAILVRVTDRLNIAPEIRLTSGFITNDRYTVLRTGLRVMWDF